MNVVERFKKQYPHIDIRAKFFSDPTDETFDIIISNKDKRLKNYTATKLLSEGLAIAISRENPLAAREHFDVGMLSNEPFITLNEQSSLYELTRKICADFGFTPHIAVQSDDPFYIRKCVELGLGVALVPPLLVEGAICRKRCAKTNKWICQNHLRLHRLKKIHTLVRAAFFRAISRGMFLKIHSKKDDCSSNRLFGC